MLVPKNFIETCILELKNNNIIQFQRLHINQNLSRNNPVYENINTSDTYIEEKNYWSELFNTNDWMSLPFHWKYTCTYALGISKNNFLKLGMFKKYYISYGFEDTDLGYEAALQGFNFKLIKIPLMHQTAYDLMQYRNSTSQRFKLLRVTAELFYLQHLDKKIYELLGNYLRFQKPLKSIIRDFLNY
jgi:GT2 family glycosyltransferase